MSQESHSIGHRRPYRVPLGLPSARHSWRGGTVASVLVHAVLIGLLLVDVGRSADLRELSQGAGGQGPAGGGGGGRRGSGAQPEALEYVRVAPPPETAPVAPPRIESEPVPVPQIALVPATPEPELPRLAASLPIIGVGGGTGSDETGGTGTGTGGGIGTGVGTGTGSSVGPGTGGGDQANHPPTPIEMRMPPLPVPAVARGASVIAEFDVDESGRVRSIEFTQTRDRGYNRRLREALEGYRFRPGFRPDGTPVRMKVQITIDLP